MVQWNVELALMKGLHVFEWQSLRRGGKLFFLEVRFTPCRIGDEQYFQCIAIDITEQKRAEQKISERQALLLQIPDRASVAIFLVDKAGHITHANRRIPDGGDCRERVCRPCASLRTGDRAEEDAALLAREIDSVDLGRYYWRRDGSEF